LDLKLGLLKIIKQIDLPLSLITCCHFDSIQQTHANIFLAYRTAISSPTINVLSQRLFTQEYFFIVLQPSTNR